MRTSSHKPAWNGCGAQVGGRLCNAVHAEETAAAVGGASSRVMHGGALVPASGCGAAAGTEQVRRGAVGAQHDGSRRCE